MDTLQDVTPYIATFDYSYSVRYIRTVFIEEKNEHQ